MRFFLFLITTISIAADFSTSLGGAYPYSISAIATDQAGNTYIVGSRTLAVPATAFRIGTDGIVSGLQFGGSDVFVSKLDPTGKLLFTDTFAGKGSDRGIAIALDPSGNIYIAGTTTSNDFPLSKPLQNQASSTSTGFIIKLTNDGTTILYSTYFGGVLGSTSITALATDSKGNLYLTGITTSADFPNIGSALSPGSSGAIYAAISAAGDKILYAGANFAGTTPSQGGFNTFGLGVALDASGNAYFAYNDVAPIYGPGSPDGYLAKLDPTGKNIFTANLGSYVSALAVDPAGNVYVGLGINGPVQASIAKLGPDLSIPWINTLQSEATSVTSIAVDAAGNVWATGEASPGFPNANGWTTGGSEFLVRLNPSGSALTYSALYPEGTVAESIAVDPLGLVHVAGSTGFVSAIAPNTASSMKIFGFQNGFGGNLTARISPAEVISIYGPGIGPSAAAAAAPVNGFYPKTFAGVQVTVNGQNMPLLHVSANQINAVVPMGIAPGAAATIRVINGTAVSPDYPVWMVDAAPVAYPTVLNQDGTINFQTHPARSGTVITFYATGWQSDFFQLADGQVATAAQAVFSGNCCVSSIQGVSGVAVPYAGAAPGIVAGVSQFNIKLGTVSTVGHVSFSVNALTDTAYQVNQSVWIAP
jgi:uncharacterized protein (TIGR03437 family)